MANVCDPGKEEGGGRLTAQFGAPAHHCAEATAGARTAATADDFMMNKTGEPNSLQ